MPARTQLAGNEHTAADAGLILGQHLELQESVVDEHGVADVDVLDQVLVIDVDGANLLGAGAGLDGEVEDFARFQLDRDAEIARANLGPLDVHHDGHFPIHAFADLPNAANDAAGPIVLGVGHVEPDDVGAGAEQLFKHGLTLGRGTEGEDDFGSADGVGSAHG